MTERRWHRPAALAALCATAAALSALSHEAAAQIPAAASSQQAAPISYSRAEQLLNWHTTLLVSGDEVAPQWLPDGNRFWYRNKTPSGAEFVLIDPVRNARALVFDNARLAAAMSTARDTSY